jgi:hypothetical protein
MTQNKFAFIKKFSFFVLVSAFIISFNISPSFAQAEETATADVATTEALIVPVVTPVLSTDKDDYHPGESATIFGKSFQSLQSYILKIFGTDENDQNYTESIRTVTADNDGSFSSVYNLDSLYRPFYKMAASTTDGTLLAEGYFRDSAIGTYDQCSNDLGTGYGSGDTGCRWTNGNLQSNNSTYIEGDSTVQRLWIEGYAPGSSHTVTFKYGTTKGGKRAYDFLTTWDASESWITVADRCQDITGCSTVSETTLAIPSDTNGSGQFETGTRNFVMRGGTLNSATSPAIVSGTYAGDSETIVTVSFTVANSGDMCKTKSGITSCGIAIWFGAHIAKTSDWNPFDGTSGAGSISGSPYHVALSQEDGASVGNRDNQMQANAIIPASTITIHKVTTPNPADTTLFNFSTTGTGYSNFTLTGGNQNVQNITGTGSFSVTEALPTNWTNTALTCNATGTGSSATPNLANHSVAITIGSAGGATIDCTYTNNLVQQGHIIVDKVTNPSGDTQSFSFTAGGTGYNNFSLTDTATPNDQTLNAGTYSISEGAVSGWTQTSATCSDGSPINAIVLSAGETITCTFTNTKNATLTLIKTVTNDNGGTAVANDFQAKIDGANVPWGVAQVVTAASHTASEVTLPGYTATSWGGDCAANGTVTLAPGQNKICSITNNDNAPSLTLNKVVVNNNGGIASESEWTLTANGGSAGTLTGAGAVGSADVVSGVGFKAGTYALSESTGPAGYSASLWSCIGVVNVGSNITLGLGQSAVCTITNDDIAPTLTLVKTVTNTHGGTATAANFQAKIDGGNVAWSSAQAVTAGSHTASESTLAGYTAGAWGGDCAANGSVTLALAENKTCTITNSDQPAHIIVIKHVDNGNTGATTNASAFTMHINGTAGTASFAGAENPGVNTEVNAGTFAVTEDEATGYSSSMSGDCSGSIGVGETKTCTITNTAIAPTLKLIKIVTNDNGGTAVANDFQAKIDNGNVAWSSAQAVTVGSHSASETNLTGYTASDWTGDCAEDGSVTLALAENKTCTITNDDQAGHLIVHKVTNPTDTTTEFSITASGTHPVSGATQSIVGGSQVDYTVDAGTYSVAETPAEYWDEISNTCASVVIANGETKECTITNKERGHLIVQKTTLPAGNTTEFSILASGTGTIDHGGAGIVTDATDKDYEVTSGTYSVVETVPAGWAKTGDTCQNVVVEPGQTATCLLTNTKLANLTIVKDADINDSQDFAFSGTNGIGAFTLDDDAGVQEILDQNTYSNSKNFTNLSVNQDYTITEAGANGWTLKNVSCVETGTENAYQSTSVANGVTVNLTPGANVTCTFVNTNLAPTRTQGFWQTHTAYTSSVFNTTNPMKIGANVAKIDTVGKLFGAFYSDISKKSNSKTQRTAVDKTRMVLLQQLVAAKLNCAAFGCGASTLTLISNADAAFASGDIAGMNISTGLLDAYNNSGDSMIITGTPGKATPKDSQTIADKPFWDALP